MVTAGDHRRPWRRAGLFAGASLVVVAILAAILWSNPIDGDRFRPRVRDALRSATGRRVSMEGRLTIESMLPPVLAATDVVLGNFASGSRPDMVRARRAELTLGLAPLLRGRFEVDGIALHDADVVLETDANGRGNWTFEPKGESDERRTFPEIRVDDSSFEVRNQATRWHAAAKVQRLRIRGGPLSTDHRFSIALVGDRSDVTGDGTVRFGTRPALTAKLRSRILDLADLGPKDQPSNRFFSDRPLAFDTFRSIALDVEVDADRLIAKRLPFEGLTARIRSQKSDVAIREIHGRFAGGKMSGEVDFAGASGPAEMHAKLTVRDADFRKFWKDLAVDDAFTGTAFFAADVKGRGDSWHSIFAALEGAIDFAVRDGSVHKDVVDRVAPRLLDDAFPWVAKHDDTRLHCVVGGLDVHGGVAVTRILLLESGGMTVLGKGSIDFGGETIDVALDPYPKDPELLQLAFPIAIDGPLVKPRVRPQKLAIVEALADSVLRTAIAPAALTKRFVDTGFDDESECIRDLASPEAIRERIADKRKAVTGLRGFARKVGDKLESAIHGDERAAD